MKKIAEIKDDKNASGINYENQNHLSYSNVLFELIKKQKKLYHLYYHSLQEFNSVKEERHRIDRAIKYEMKKHKLTIHHINQLNETILLVPSKTRIIIDSEDSVPLEYVSIFMKRQLDLKKIKRDLLQGKAIPGVRLAKDEIIEYKTSA